VTAPKGGRLRYVPMTTRLASAMRERRHLRGKLVLCQTDGGGRAHAAFPRRSRAAGLATRGIAAIEGAIRLLEPAQALQTFGDILETAHVETRN
jgi:hypothetical protein